MLLKPGSKEKPTSLLISCGWYLPMSARRTQWITQQVPSDFIADFWEVGTVAVKFLMSVECRCIVTVHCNRNMV